MRSILRLFIAGSMLAFFGATLVTAQAINFTLLVVPTNGNPATVLNGQQIDLVAPNVGGTSQVTIVATYTGSTQATIAAAPQVLGSTAIKVVPAASESFPLVLTRGQTLTFAVTYTASSAGQVSAQVSIPYTEPGTTTTTVNNTITLLFVGQAPSFTLSYILQSDNNVVPIAPGGTIPFPGTILNTTAQAQLNITNTGSGPGTITDISLVSGGPNFKLSGLPLFPFTLSTTGTTNLPIGILYTPSAVENDTGQIKITFQDGSSDTVNLTGSGITSVFSYSYLIGTTSTPVAPGQTIVFPPVASTGTTSASSSVIVQVKNKGTTSGTISSITVSGPGFALATPVSTAPVVPPGGTYSFTISFTPTQVSQQTGTLAVGNDVFTLAVTGPALTFSYVSDGVTIPVGAGGTVDFVPIPVSQSETVTLTVTNSGTSSAIISLISTSSPFSLTPAPALPLTLAVGQSKQLGITFTPTTTGPATGTLLINNTTVTLAGAGTTPTAVPSYTISGPSGNVPPASQQNVSLTLSKPYAAELDGVLTITTSGNFGTDPAVQFSTGSSAGNRTVDFVIPANSTSANFAGQGSQILIQTGTVAESVTLAPSFTTAGGVTVTQASPSTLEFTVASLAPVLQGLQITNTTSSSFTLLVIGYSTTRSLGSLSVTFNPAAGYNLATTTFSTDLSQAGALWYQKAASQAFGGQFEISIPFNLTGPVSSTKTLLQSLASVSVTVSNSIGTSTPAQANIQ